MLELLFKSFNALNKIIEIASFAYPSPNIILNIFDLVSSIKVNTAI